jgi:hypothetical protein
MLRGTVFLFHVLPMPWHTAFNSELRIIESTFSGLVPPQELGQSVQSAIAIGLRERVGRCLTDCSRIEGGHSLFDLLAQIDNIQVNSHQVAIKEALIMPATADSAERAQFWEDACRNRGLNVRIFPERGAALAWLCA